MIWSEWILKRLHNLKLEDDEIHVFLALDWYKEREKRINLKRLKLQDLQTHFLHLQIGALNFRAHKEME